MPSRDGILGKILDRILGRIRRIAGSQLPPTASKGSWQHQIISTMIHSATVTTKTRFVRRLIIKLFFESEELFVMDVRENGNNRPKPLNPTVIGSSLRERMRASCRKWREKNKQRCHEYFRNYRQKRKELAMSMQESKKELGEEEKEKQRQTRSQWREKNREKCRQYVRNYRLKTKSAHQSPDLSKELKEKNKEWQKNWKERNKERCREYVRNYRRKRQLGQITMDVTPDITIEGKDSLTTANILEILQYCVITCF